MKNIVTIICLFGFFISGAFAAGEKVEDVFYDIDTSYQYRDELQVLYDRGMIVPDISGVFGPDSFLNRDEFVGISMEVICERCIQPHTKFEIIEKYFNEKVYFDLDNRNPYFYCIAEADTQNYVRGYDISESCQNGSSKFGERPFCPQNRINLEEAVAVLLRNSGIHSIEDNREVINDINNGTITKNLSNDVSPRNTDGSAYTFYGYLQKALDYEIIEYDTQGNQKTQRLLEPDIDGNIFPEKQISKEEFLRMSYIVLKSNSCVAPRDSEIALTTDIYDANCTPGSQECEISQLDDTRNIYDFSAKSDGFCSEGINEQVGYNWRFHNITNGEEFFRYGKYLDDITLPSSGEWRVYLTAKDRCENSGQMYSTIVVAGDTPLSIVGDIQVFPGSCDSDCDTEDEIPPRDIGDGPLGDPDDDTGPDDSYDIIPDVTTSCPSGIDESSYRWTLTNLDTGGITIREETSIDDFIFSTSGAWKIQLSVGDNCSKSFTRDIYVYIPDSETPKDDTSDDTPSGNIIIFPGSCDSDCDTEDEIPPRDIGDGPLGDPDDDTGPDDSYDIIPDVTTSCPSGIDESSYRWTLTNLNNGVNITQAVRELNDFTFASPGEWRISMSVRDTCGDLIENILYINIPGEQEVGDVSLGVTIRTNTLLGYTDFIGRFEGVVDGGQPPYSYSWDFGNGTSGIGKDIDHVYSNDGVYDVSLNVIDSQGLSGSATVIIKVLDGNSCEQDTDGDGIVDCEDLCILVSGATGNAGCPILEERCDQNCGCRLGYSCDDSDPLTCGVSGVCKAEFTIGENCLYDPKRGSVFGSTLCTTCPCSSNLDFLADIRACDIVFPAITSPDGTEIYSQGNFWEVQ